MLENALERSSVLLVVIGKRWAESWKIGARRIDETGDFMRMVVAAGAVESPPVAKQPDAVLAQIEALLPDSGSGRGACRVNHIFRSRADGAGLTVATGDPTGVHWHPLPPAARSATRALPDSFVDLPDAITTAREAGMFGLVTNARLSIAGSRSGHPTWRLRPIESAQSRVYDVDAVTGRIAPPPSTSSSHDRELIGKVKGIFHQ